MIVRRRHIRVEIESRTSRMEIIAENFGAPTPGPATSPAEKNGTEDSVTEPTLEGDVSSALQLPSPKGTRHDR